MFFAVKIIKGLLGLLFRLFLLPLIAALTIVHCICTVAAQLSALFFDLVGAIFIVTGILSFYFELEPIDVMWRMIAAGAGLYLIPMLVREFALWTALIKETIMIRLLA